jgi:hypothetical protein
LIERELADGEIAVEWLLPPTGESKAAADAAFERFGRDARTLADALAERDRRDAEWVAVFDGQVFRSPDFERIVDHVKSLGATDSPVLVRYARPRCDDVLV